VGNVDQIALPGAATEMWQPSSSAAISATAAG